MTSEEIIALAFQCGVWIPLASGPEREQTIDKLCRFAALVAATRRHAGRTPSCTTSCAQTRSQSELEHRRPR